jgi:hypothetical protein
MYVDITIIQRAARPRKEIEVYQDRKEEETITIVTETLSKDKDARWIKNTIMKKPLVIAI